MYVWLLLLQLLVASLSCRRPLRSSSNLADPSQVLPHHHRHHHPHPCAALSRYHITACATWGDAISLQSRPGLRTFGRRLAAGKRDDNAIETGPEPAKHTRPFTSHGTYHNHKWNCDAAAAPSSSSSSSSCVDAGS
ncbi:hypothetical protein IWX49DRAFT_552910 [Phyllosticta citricarpa]